MIAVEGQPFHDPAADAALFGALREHLDAGRRAALSSTLDINDRAFALAMADRLHALLRGLERGSMTARARRSNACAPRSPPAGRSSAPAPAPGSRAKCAEAGGVDLIIIYNSGRYRMAGRG